MLKRKILVMGLPGSGKTTLAKLLAARLGAVHFDADEVRANIEPALGFSFADRLKQAHRMGWMCDLVVKAGHYAIADFVCPTTETREAFGASDATVIWVDRIETSRYADTNALFDPPLQIYDIRVGATETAAAAVKRILHDQQAPTALLLGRYQPFHDGHKALALAAIKRVGRVCIAVRDTCGTDDTNPFPFADVRARIESAMSGSAGKFTVIAVPNITKVMYGRDVGYGIEEIVLPEAIQAISATEIRKQLAATA